MALDEMKLGKFWETKRGKAPSLLPAAPEQPPPNLLTTSSSLEQLAAAAAPTRRPK